MSFRLIGKGTGRDLAEEAHHKDVRPNVVLNVQYLRGIAALAVVLFHTCEANGIKFSIGAAGVDLFFIISGFIMWTTTFGKRISTFNFLRRRVERVVPLYWLVTAATSIAILVKPNFLFGHTLTITKLIGSLLFVPPVKSTALDPVVIQGWTLTYEMIFYFIFAVALVEAPPKRVIFISAALMIWVLIGAIVPFLGPFSSPLMLEFLAGVWIGAVWKRGVRLPLKFAAGMVAVGFVGMAVANWRVTPQLRVLTWGIPALLIVAGAVYSEGTVGVSKVGKFLGDASYSIYLWHVLMLSLATAVTLRLGVPGSTLVFVQFLFATTGSVLLYLVAERRMNRYFQTERVQRAPSDTLQR